MSESIQIAAAAVATSPQSSSSTLGQGNTDVSADDPSGFNAMFTSYVETKPATSEQELTGNMMDLFNTSLPPEMLEAGNSLPEGDIAFSWQALNQLPPVENSLSSKVNLNGNILLEQQDKSSLISSKNSPLLNQQLSQELVTQNLEAGNAVASTIVAKNINSQVSNTQLMPDSTELITVSMDEQAIPTQTANSTVNQSIAAVGLGTATQAAVSQSQTAPLNLGQNAWESNLGSRLQMLIGQNVQTAEIRLDPPELGALDIKIKVTNDVATVHITSPHSHVREAVETSVPRLREMFEESGLSLGDVNVQQESFTQKDEQPEDNVFGVSGDSGGDVVEESLNVTNKIPSTNLLDIYA